MKNFIPVLFFIICLLGCASTNSVVNNKIVIPETEKTVLRDYNAPNPLLNTNVEGVFVLKQPYCDIEKYKNTKEYRLYLLDKNTDEVLYIIENVVINWQPSHNDGWGGRIVKDDFCCFTKDNVEYRIKGDIYAIEVHSYLEGIYLTEDGEDLLNPVIRDDIDEDIKKIEQGFVDYVLYPDLVERGFNIHKLDNMKIDGEMFEYIESFFRPNDEKGWLPLDNHHELHIKDENGKWYQSPSYKKKVIFTKEYGTKDELLKKGYVENETMFYYPSNGEKDWRVGEWSWFDYKGDWNWSSGYRNQEKSLSFVGEKLVKDDITHVETLETEKSFIIAFLCFKPGINDVELVEKDNLIIDMSYNEGGSMNSRNTFVERVLKSNYKKIIVIANDAGSSGDVIVEQLSKDKRTIVIGKNTNGTVKVEGSEVFNKIDNKYKFYFKSMSTKDSDDTSIMEGIGFIPDIWANNELDVFKNIWNITNDYEIKTNDYSRIIDHDNYKWNENNKSWNY